MRILHLSADFPDPLAPGKTRAVANLLELVPEHEHYVYSLNRVGRGRAILAHDFGDRHRALAYGAPGRGIFLAGRLDRLADWILADLMAREISPDFVHAHKLSVEGLAGERIAARLDIPLVVSSQGNSDARIIAARPDLIRRWRRIWQNASVALPFAPWTAQWLERALGPRRGPTCCLPCPTGADAVLPPRPTRQRILTAFRLDHFAIKGAGRLIAAADMLRAERPELELAIAGGGSPAALTSFAARIGGRPHVRLLGPVAQADLQREMNASALFALPSRRESYGMVFAEALLAGCPVLHGTGNGPSGYFPDAIWARPAPRGGAESLACALGDMLENQVRLKRDLETAQQDGTLAVLRRDGIAGRYREALSLVDLPKTRAAA